MCELFAVNAQEPVVVNRLLTTFFSHSVNHPHGWGVAWRHSDGQVELHKGPERAIDSPELSWLLGRTIMYPRLLAHIRNATEGGVSYHNSHPFDGVDVSGVEWVMIHNGAIIHDDLLSGYDRWTEGETDSERILMFLLDLIEEATLRVDRGLTFAERFDLLSRAINQLANGNLLNIILDDGEHLYVHTNTIEETLYGKQTQGSVVLSTKPLDEGEWHPVPRSRLIAFKGGRVERMSMPHLNAVCDEEVLRFLSAGAPAKQSARRVG